ncbi:hypothetical protein NDU88_000943 [Pleurodeles waltl]|uniref:DUF4371 domain-containing protein n=1 Tax=Pleurodeles waltl TaxID=8319 RepID=A0AAV7SY52_PLEWA|nr:hypothetical protein NDU88_000943 [Pleurodeles waltl]
MASRRLVGSGTAAALAFLLLSPPEDRVDETGWHLPAPSATPYMGSRDPEEPLGAEDAASAFELVLRGHDETEESLNPGVFRGLVDFVSSIDSAMEAHLKSATVFKGTSKTIQNELLDCMLEVTRETIVQQLRSTDYVAIQADDTTDVSTKTQSVLVFCYIDGNSKVVERFYCFSYLKDTISAAILNELNLILPERSGKEKLIAQSYDGASVMRGASGGVPKKIRDIYPNAHYVHCYAHQLNLIMEQAASKISRV